ncbi:MAG: cation:proton antiporter, partial [Flavobacterium sp.]
VWESFCFVLNGIVFLLIGLDLPEITEGLGEVSLSSAIGYGILITAVLMVARIISAYGAVVVTLIARNFIKVADSRNPGYKIPLLIGWSGMRGVVSLAAALSIPLHLNDGNPFPQRNLILFITFVVILLTLLIQGLTLPYLIRKININDPDQLIPVEETEIQIRRELAEKALQHLHTNYSELLHEEPALQQLASKWEHNRQMTTDVAMAEECKVVYLEILSEQRTWLINRNKADASLNEEIIRKQLRYLDLEEERLRYV